MNGTKIQKFDSTKFRYCPVVSYAIIKFNLATEMAEIDFENGDFRKFKGSVTLTLKVISFDLSHRPLFISLYISYGSIEFDCEQADRHLSTNVNRSSLLKAKMA